MQEYKNIIAIDFELYNTKHYWSICWAGLVLADLDFNEQTSFDIIINPTIKEQFTGRDLVFPFSSSDLAKRENFNKHSDKILGFLKKDTLVIGHAFENDIKMLIDACKKYNLELPEFDFIDSNIIYNEYKNANGEHSLTALAQEFEIEFDAHNPMHDAMATLRVVKECVKKQGLQQFFKNNKIQVGKIQAGTYTRCYSKKNKPTKSTKNLNDLQKLVSDIGQGVEESYFFDSSITNIQDISEIYWQLLSKNKRIALTEYSCDIIVTNNLLLEKNDRIMSFKKLVKSLGFDVKRYNYSPKKVRDEHGHNIGLTDYYNKKYSGYRSSGELDGVSFSFSNACLNSEIFDKFLKTIYSKGAYINANVLESDFFLVNSKSEISRGTTDGRVKAFFRAKLTKAVEISEFFESLDK